MTSTFEFPSDIYKRFLEYCRAQGLTAKDMLTTLMKREMDGMTLDDIRGYPCPYYRKSRCSECEGTGKSKELIDSLKDQVNPLVRLYKSCRICKGAGDIEVPVNIGYILNNAPMWREDAEKVPGLLLELEDLRAKLQEEREERGVKS